MASLTDLVNLNLSDCTDKIIAEYIWLASLCSCTASDLNCLKLVFVLYCIRFVPSSLVAFSVYDNPQPEISPFGYKRSMS
jgi:hypothetical protein